ncbi:hypothetical protein [Spectribacter hydrogenoxidans]|uniref:Phage gp6-like head-tail connector protein n=1 Tax=Spectribacter hydrogenoxidans TaxID=3075608 RepID=A0ABU3C0H1_9GAMM|nr:hypothetical protein [Salinisphaera sp. W335]MDT0635049.1 hypothetical protein [Salinisphaera sp. W335]
MVELLSVTEGQPSSYPSLPADVSSEASTAIEAATVWQRIEAWIAYRWNERSVTWVVQGPGVWLPPLRPYTVDSAEAWNGQAYESVTLTDAPVGFELDGKAYKVQATVGDTDDPPDIVDEAVRRLTEYLYQVTQDPVPGHTTATDGDYSFTRSAGWAARAIQHSGAGDLLRAYR